MRRTGRRRGGGWSSSCRGSAPDGSRGVGAARSPGLESAGRRDRRSWMQRRSRRVAGRTKLEAGRPDRRNSGARGRRGGRCSVFSCSTARRRVASPLAATRRRVQAEADLARPTASSQGRWGEAAATLAWLTASSAERRGQANGGSLCERKGFSKISPRRTSFGVLKAFSRRLQRWQETSSKPLTLKPS